MTMRKSLSLVLLCLLALLAACGKQDETTAQAPATEAKNLQWKMVTTWPPNFPIFQEGVVRFAQDVKVMTNGRLDIQVFAGGELVPPLETFDAVSQGTVQLGHGAAYYWAGKVPEAQFFTAVPFGMNAQGMNAWFYGGGGLELWQETYSSHNLVPFPMGNTGVQMGGWFNKKIDKVDDLKGLKMRIPGLGGKVLAKAGGTPVLMAGGEIYTNLERGQIDATEWVGPFHDERLGLYRAAKFYYYPGWHEPGTALELIVNKAAWETLPADLKKIVEAAAADSNIWMLAQFEAQNLKALQTLRDEYKVQVLPFPDEVIAKLRQLSQEVLDEEAGKSENFKKVYEAYKTFATNNRAWSKLSEVAYSKAQGE